MKYFVFMDESGNTKEEQYFGLGLLFVPVEKIGQIYDDLRSFYDRAKDIAKLKKIEKIEEFINKQDFISLKKIVKASSDFEMKFKSINFTNKDIYKGLVDKYMSYSMVKFSSLIISKSNGIEQYDYRDLYIQRASMLFANTVNTNNEYVLICDSITQPKSKMKKFENSMIDAIKYRLKKKGYNKDILLGVLRLESHSSIMLQLVDTLLGCVMYFTKKKQGLVSIKSIEKKGFVAESLQKKVGFNFLETKTVSSPNYFNVWHYKKGKRS